MPSTPTDIAHAFAAIKSTSSTSRDRNNAIQSLLKITRKLWHRWSKRLKTRAIGFDLDDARQEAAIAISEAAEDYNPKLPAFPFLYTVMTRRFAGLMNHACRPCRDQPQSMMYADRYHADAADRAMIHYLPSHSKPPRDPETIDEYDVTVAALMTIMSVYQLDTFIRRHKHDQSYADIAAETGRDFRSVDNAIQRCREKLAEAHAEDAQELLQWSKRYR